MNFSKLSPFFIFIFSFSFHALAQKSPRPESFKILNSYLEAHSNIDTKEFFWKNAKTEHHFISSTRNSDPNSIENCKLYLGKAQTITFGDWADIFPESKNMINEEFKNKLEKLMKPIENESQLAKDYYKRLRPFKISENSFKPCVYGIFKEELLQSPRYLSFPSTHTVEARSAALYLSFLTNHDKVDNKEEFLKLSYPILSTGAKMGHYRVLAGHHFPTDVMAGEELTDFYFCEAFETALLEENVTRTECHKILAFLRIKGGIKAISQKEKWPYQY